jgi:hypothetical protein
MPLRCFASLCLIVILGCGGGGASAPSAPTLMTQPQSAMLEANSAVRLEVQAFGTPSLSYQWRKNGADLPGEVRPDLVRAPLTAADEGDYSVVVSNANGTVVSASATLHVVDHLHWVTQSGDSGAGSLREALEASNAASTSTHGILFRYPQGPWEMPGSNGELSFPTAPVLRILLAAPLPPIHCTVRIQGFIPGAVIIDGADQHRPFLVQSGQVALNRLVIAHGLAKGGDSWGGGGGAGMGGGLFIDGGNVQLEDVVFYSNRAVGGSSYLATAAIRGGGGGARLDAPVGGSGADGAPFCGIGGSGNLSAPTSLDVFADPAVTTGSCLGVFAGGGAASGSDGTGNGGTTANWGGKGGFGAGGGFAAAPGIGGDGGGLGGEFFGGGGGGVYNPSMNPVAAGGEGGLWGGSGDEAGRGGGGAGLGGAIFLRQGQISVMKRCQFRNNEAIAGAGAPNPTSAATAKAKGGAIYIYPKPYPFSVNGVSPSLDACSSGGPLDTVFPLSELLAQSYEGNVAANATPGVVDDSADFYRARCAQVPIIVRERQIWKANVRARIEANARRSKQK